MSDMMSPSLADRLGGPDPVEAEPEVVDRVEDCVLVGRDATLVGHLVEFSSKMTFDPRREMDLEVSLIVVRNSLQEALGIGEILRVDISNGDSSVTSRAIPSSWERSTSIRPMATPWGPGLLLTVRARPTI